MCDHLFISEVQFDEVIIALPALIPEAVVIVGVSSKMNMKPVLIAGILPVSLHVPELNKSPSDMIENAVQNNSDPVFMELPADVTEVLVCSKPDIDLFIISGIISMRIRFKQRAEIDCIDPEFFHMGDPVINLPDPVKRRLINGIFFIRKWSSAESKRKDLVKNTAFSPHINPPCNIA